MLVLSHADRLRVDLDKLRERILKATRYRHRRALCNIEIREFLGSELGRGVDRRARLADHDIFAIAGRLLEQSRDEYLAFL